MAFGRAKLMVAAVLVLSGVVSFPAPAALGCAFHPLLEAQFEAMYPGSLSVAVALRRAADRGVIDAAALEAPSTGADLWRLRALYIEAERRLNEFRKVLAASPVAAELPAHFSLGYVESGLWARYSQSDSTVRAEIHTEGPAEGEAVVLTGEPALTEILAGRLPVDQALADGVVLIAGRASEKTAIRDALVAASKSDSISSQ